MSQKIGLDSPQPDSEYRRSMKEIITHSAAPWGGLCPDPEGNRRLMAVAEVFRRLPNAAYTALSQAANTFSWFIPDQNMHGGVWPFGAIMKEVTTGDVTRRYAKALYLSPELENRSWDFVVAVVAHELAHIILGHSPLVRSSDYDGQEAEANATLEEWGFGQEWRVCQAWHRRQNQKEQRLIAALTAAR